MTESELLDISKKLKSARKAKKRELFQKYQNPPEKMAVEFFPYLDRYDSDFFLSTKWLFNGSILHLGKLHMLIDPGAELLSRMNHPEELFGVNAVFISHAHIDHYASANVALDTMRLPSREKEVHILAGQQVYDEKIITDYHLGIEEELQNTHRIVLQENETVDVLGVKITPIRMSHNIKDTFGFIAEYDGKRIGYISDTGYTQQFKTTLGEIVESGAKDYDGEFDSITSKYEYLKSAYKGVDFLITCMNDLRFNEHSKYHLSGYDVIDILKESGIKECIISTSQPVDILNEGYDEKISSYISLTTKVKSSIIPRTGLIVNL